MSIATNPIITDHRLTRFLTVVWLRLLRMLGNLLVGQVPYHDELQAMSRFIAAFILIRACKQLDPNPRPARRIERPTNAPHGFVRRRRVKSYAFVRTAVGSELWRRLRGRGSFAHVAALIAAILNLDAITAQLVKRMQRRLTRLRPLVLVYAHADAPTGLAFACATQAPDSS